MHQTQTDLLACPLFPIGNVSNRHFVVHASAKRTDVYKNSETMPGMTVALSDTDELLLSDDAAMPAARSVPPKRPAPKSAAAATSAKRACACGRTRACTFAFRTPRKTARLHRLMLACALARPRVRRHCRRLAHRARCTRPPAIPRL